MTELTNNALFAWLVNLYTTQGVYKVETMGTL